MARVAMRLEIFGAAGRLFKRGSLGPDMLHRFVTRIAGFLGLSLLCAALPAHADNIPGSPGQVVPELTETATDLQVRSIKDNMRPLRAPGSAGVSVSTSGVVDGIGGSFGGDTPLALRLDSGSEALSCVGGVQKTPAG